MCGLVPLGVPILESLDVLGLLDDLLLGGWFRFFLRDLLDDPRRLHFLSFVGRRVVELVGPPTAFLRRGTGVPWVSLLGPTSVPQSPGCGVVTSCVLCARVRVSRSCATENTHTPARLEALFELSVVTIL